MIKKTLSVLLAVAMAVSVIPFFKLQTEASNLVITIDPGHGYNPDTGSYTGATGAMQWGGLQEDFYNWDIAVACHARLLEYGATVHMTKDSVDGYPSFDERVMMAVNTGSAAFVSIHNNMAAASASGSNIFIVNPNYNYQMYVNTVSLSRCVMDRLVNDAGTKEQTPPYYVNADWTNPDGSAADYYAVLYRSKIWSEGKYTGSKLSAAMIVECVFQSNEYDVKNFLMKPEKLEAMGVAIADGIADYYGLDFASKHWNNIDDTEGMTSKDTSSRVVKCEASVTKGTAFEMKGWSVNEEGLSTYQGSLDGGAWYNIESYFRDDVYTHNQADYPNCTDMNSFKTTLDTSSLSYGTHTFDIRGVTKTGATYNIAEYNIKIKPDSDSTFVSVANTVITVDGSFSATAKGLVDKAWVGLFGVNETPGVISSYCWYEMQTAGVTYSFDLFKDGTFNDRGKPGAGSYKLVLFATEDSSQPIDEVPITILENGIQHSLDTKDPYTVEQGKTFHVSGWGASVYGMTGYAYDVDGIRAAEYLKTCTRADDVIPHLVNSGFPITVDDIHAFKDDISTASMSVGVHTVTIVGITSEGEEFEIGSVAVTVTEPVVTDKITGDVTVDRDTDTNTSYIKDIDLNTTAEELISKLTQEGCVVKDKNGNIATGKLGTGCTVELIVDGVVKDSAVIIVKADLDGDAMATSKDVILAKLYRQSQTGGNVAKLASDLDGNGTVSATDVTAIAQAVAAN